MMPLNVTTWWWGDKYDWTYVAKLIRGLDANISGPYRMVVVTDRSDVPDNAVDQVIGIGEVDRPLLEMKGCMARLRMFQPEWQHRHYLEGRIVCIDLDTVITGTLDPVFDRPEPFVILQGANASNPCPYVGALMMLQAGHHREVWDDFSIEAVQKIPRHEFPDDQGWIAHKLPGAAGWKAGTGGVYAFMKPGWPNKDGALPADARIVTFPGHRDPARFQHLPWVQRHWT